MDARARPRGRVFAGHGPVCLVSGPAGAGLLGGCCGEGCGQGEAGCVEEPEDGGAPGLWLAGGSGLATPAGALPRPPLVKRLRPGCQKDLGTGVCIFRIHECEVQSVSPPSGVPRRVLVRFGFAASFLTRSAKNPVPTPAI